MNKLRYSKSLLVLCALMLVGLAPDPASMEDPLPRPPGADKPVPLTATADSSGSPAAQSDKTPVAADEASRAPESSAEGDQSEDIIASDTTTDEYSEASVATEESEATIASQSNIHPYWILDDGTVDPNIPESGPRGNCCGCNPFGECGCCGGLCVCESGCSSTFCALGCNPQNFCHSSCGRECDVICGGDPICDPACGGDPCNVLCSPGPCGSGCPDECSAIVCTVPRCSNPNCDPCAAGCVCEPTCSSTFCDPFCNPTNALCLPECGGSPCNVGCNPGPCGSGCPDECSAVTCLIPRCSNPNCDPCAAGCVCEPTCSGTFCNAVCNPTNALCLTECGGSPCNFGCNPGPCGSGCPDECDPFICSESPCAQPQCGGVNESACDVAIQLLHAVSACQSGLREVFAPPCGVGGAPSCYGVAISWCVEITPCGGDGERACCIGEGDTCDPGLAQTNFVLSEGQCTTVLGLFNCGGCSAGVCFAPSPCGGLGQRACCVGENGFPLGGCGEGLIEQTSSGCTLSGLDCWCDGGLAESGGMCVDAPCGGERERACCALEVAWGACESGLHEVCDLTLCAGSCEADLGGSNCVCTGGLTTSMGICDRSPSSDEINRLWLQNHIDDHVPLIDATFVGTHNSYNTSTDSYPFPQQLTSVTSQLNVGARAINFDVHVKLSNSLPILCHSIASACGENDRLFSDGMAEVNTWLNDNPGELVFMVFEDFLNFFDLDMTARSNAVAIINNTVGPKVYSPAFHTGNANQACRTLPFGLTKAGILATGKQIILTTADVDDNDNPVCIDPSHAWRDWVWNTRVKAFKGDAYNNSVMRFSDKFGFVFEDRLLGVLDGTQQLNPSETLDALKQGAAVIGLDYLVWVNRHPAMIWSWAPNEPDGGETQNCAAQNGDGSWSDRACSTSLRHACLNTADGTWAVSTTSGTFSEGLSKCNDLGPAYVFGVPVNAKQNADLNTSRNGTGVWLAWTDANSEGTWGTFDPCPLDDPDDSDFDGVCDSNDLCPGFDDGLDADLDSVPDGCDACPGSDDMIDSDGDGAPDDCDLCEGSDDNLDADGDTVPDGCDVCPGGDDLIDSDGDGIPNACDDCQGDPNDADGDGVPDNCDICPGFDDNVDCNSNGVPDCVELSAEGLIGTYYPNNDFTGTPTVRVDPVVNFDWGTGEPFPGFGVDNFSIRWTGYVRSESVGNYTFTTRTDDGVRLWVDGQSLIDNWTTHAPQDESAAIVLAANADYAITMEFFEAGGGAVAQLRWTPPGGSDVVIPATNLIPNIDCNDNDVPDDCDPDTDGDGVPDDCDLCEGFDDNVDTDGDDVPDGCDACPGFDDNLDSDGDGVPDGCETGACCFADGSCQVQTASDCAGAGGAYQGDVSVCDPNPCPQPTGACCFIDGSCLIQTAGDCDGAGGTYQGDDSVCDPNPCPQPTGACCDGDGSCLVQMASDCAGAGGAYQGDDTVCDPNECPLPTGACCTTTNTCEIQTESECMSAGGDYQGDDATCDSDPCVLCGFVNPSFETGDFTGWTVQDLLSPFFRLLVADAGLNTFGWSWSSAATDGIFTAFHGFDGNGLTSGFPIVLAQDVTLEEVGLTFDWRAAWDLQKFCSDCSDREFDVVIREVGGGAELGRFNILTAAAGTINPDTGQQSSLVDLSAFGGQTVEVAFEWTIPDDSSGPGQFQFDNVCLVPLLCGDSDFPACGGECPAGTGCAPNDAAGICECAPLGGCCIDADGDGIIRESCLIETEDGCAALGGAYHGDDTVCLGTGACCFDANGDGINDACIQIDGACCDGIGGTFQAGEACPTDGACCFDDGSCAPLTEDDCASQAGQYGGPCTSCDPNLCPQPMGACCFDDGSCLVPTEIDCSAAGGAYQGDGTDCTTDSDGDSVADVCDFCPGTPSGVPVDPSGCPIPCGDSNVDLDAYANFESCLLGPGGGLAQGCACFDADGDGDVTLEDFGEFQELFTGK